MTKVHKWIKIGGLMSFIPVMMAAGPLGGYFLADFLVKKFHFPNYTAAICITLGFVVGVRETIRVVRLALKTEEEEK